MMSQQQQSQQQPAQTGFQPMMGGFQPMMGQMSMGGQMGGMGMGM